MHRRPSEPLGRRSFHNELENDSSRQNDWDSPSGPVQQSLNYGDPPPEAPLGAQASNRLRSSFAGGLFRSAGRLSVQSSPERLNRIGAVPPSTAPPSSPNQSISNPDIQDEGQRLSKCRSSVERARTVSRPVDPSLVQVDRNRHPTDNSSVRSGLSSTHHAPREPRAMRRGEPRTNVSGPAYRSPGINPFGRDPGAANRSITKRTSTEYVSPAAVRPTVEPPIAEPLKMEVTEQGISSIPERSADNSDTARSMDERSTGEVSRSSSASNYRYASDIFGELYSRNATESGVDGPTTSKPATKKTRLVCTACGSNKHSTGECHIPSVDGTTIICPFHDVSVLSKPNPGHALDGERRSPPNNSKILLYCTQMMEFEDIGPRRNYADFKECLKRAFDTFVVRRKRKPFCRVVKSIHCPIRLTIKYSEVFCRGETPPQLRDGWPYTKRDATNPEIVGRLRGCGEHDWTKMPQGELEKMTWAQIKKNYGTEVLPPQLHVASKPKGCKTAANAAWSNPGDRNRAS
ncbi:hypothetical protein KVR01_004141 [Diaporthe batatas]|uniref:uncharacterized protein n=1 Tax=Diaporthe batatas TaxID=748121 RepID=UPI001D04CA2B|nr:uncharacterized protein KVR01_004141 [Diaporthe batatas]KAG8165589.1 hypothetical protein KVR01_004141 [Diaporthe batatas]